MIDKKFGKLNDLFPAVQKTNSFRVIATDYTTYAIHWSCYSLLGIHFGKPNSNLRIAKTAAQILYFRVMSLNFKIMHYLIFKLQNPCG